MRWHSSSEHHTAPFNEENDNKSISSVEELPNIDDDDDDEQDFSSSHKPLSDVDGGGDVDDKNNRDDLRGSLSVSTSNTLPPLANHDNDSDGSNVPSSSKNIKKRPPEAISKEEPTETPSLNNGGSNKNKYSVAIENASDDDPGLDHAVSEDETANKPLVTWKSQNQQSTCEFTHTINNYSQKRESGCKKAEYSATTVDGFGNRWRLIVYVNGNGRASNHHLSLFLQVADAEELPFGWKKAVSYVLTLEHPNGSNVGYAKRNPDKTFKLCPKAIDWGWSQFITSDRIQQEGYVSNDSLIVRASVTVKHSSVSIDSEDAELYLKCAVEEGKADAVKVCLKQGAGVNCQFRDDLYTPLHTACSSSNSKGSLEVLNLLLECGANGNACNKWKETPLLIAANNGHKAAVEALLRNGAQPSLCSEAGWSALTFAGHKGYQEIVTLLLKAGAPVNCRVTEDLSTPLHKACAGGKPGHLSAVKQLLEANADVHALNKWRETPLLTAANHGQAAAVEALLKSGGDPCKCTDTGWSPLSIAAYKGHDDVVRLLLEEGAPTEEADPTLSALLQAATKGLPDTVEILLRHGADHTVTTKKGDTALSILVEQNLIDAAVEMVTEYKASVHRCSRDRKKVQRARLLINLRVKQQQREGLLALNSDEDDDESDHGPDGSKSALHEESSSQEAGTPRSSGKKKKKKASSSRVSAEEQARAAEEALLLELEEEDAKAQQHEAAANSKRVKKKKKKRERERQQKLKEEREQREKEEKEAEKREQQRKVKEEEEKKERDKKTEERDQQQPEQETKERGKDKQVKQKVANSNAKETLAEMKATSPKVNVVPKDTTAKPRDPKRLHQSAKFCAKRGDDEGLLPSLSPVAKSPAPGKNRGWEKAKTNVVSPSASATSLSTAEKEQLTKPAQSQVLDPSDGRSVSPQEPSFAGTADVSKQRSPLSVEDHLESMATGVVDFLGFDAPLDPVGDKSSTYKGNNKPATPLSPSVDDAHQSSACSEASECLSNDAPITYLTAAVEHPSISLYRQEKMAELFHICSVAKTKENDLLSVVDEDTIKTVAYRWIVRAAHGSSSFLDSIIPSWTEFDLLSAFFQRQFISENRKGVGQSGVAGIVNMEALKEAGSAMAQLCHTLANDLVQFRTKLDKQLLSDWSDKTINVTASEVEKNGGGPIVAISWSNQAQIYIPTVTFTTLRKRYVGNPSRFLSTLFAAKMRYDTTRCIVPMSYRLSSNTQACLARDAAVTVELGIDPFSAFRNNLFCGLFPDVDIAFGGLLPFGKEDGGGELPLQKHGGSVSVLPPLDNMTASLYVRRMLDVLEVADKGGVPLSFNVFLPAASFRDTNRPLSASDLTLLDPRLADGSTYLCIVEELAPTEHVYQGNVDGVTEVCPTGSLFVLLQNKAGKVHYGLSETSVADIVQSASPNAIQTNDSLLVKTVEYSDVAAGTDGDTPVGLQHDTSVPNSPVPSENQPPEFGRGQTIPSSFQNEARVTGRRGRLFDLVDDGEDEQVNEMDVMSGMLNNLNMNNLLQTTSTQDVDIDIEAISLMGIGGSPFGGAASTAGAKTSDGFS